MKFLDSFVEIQSTFKMRKVSQQICSITEEALRVSNFEELYKRIMILNIFSTLKIEKPKKLTK